MNEVTMTATGNLTRDPELRFLPNGIGMVKFALACTPRVFDKNTSQYRDGEALFLNCTAWRDLAEHIAESLSKGARVVVTGRLRQSKWQTEAGDNRTSYGLEVDDIGPSLKFATAVVKKMARRSTGFVPDSAPDDAWDTASTDRPAIDGSDPFAGPQAA